MKKTYKILTLLFLVSFKCWALSPGSYKMRNPSTPWLDYYAIFERVAGAPHTFNLFVLKKIHGNTHIGGHFHVKESSKGEFQVYNVSGLTRINDINENIARRLFDKQVNYLSTVKEYLNQDFILSEKEMESIGRVRPSGEDKIQIDINEIDFYGLFKKDDSLEIVDWKPGRYKIPDSLSTIKVRPFDRRRQYGFIVDGCLDNIFEDIKIDCKAHRLYNKLYILKSIIQYESRDAFNDKIVESVERLFPIFFVKENGGIWKDKYFVYNGRSNELLQLED